jgi:hypothetical protein
MKYGDNVTQTAECTYMNAKKLMNQKNYIMEHKKVTEIETGGIMREMQSSQRSYLEEREEEKLEHPSSIKDEEQNPSTVFTTEEETEIHQHRNQIHKLREKTESTYYQVTQITMDNRPRIQKLQNIFLN